MKRWLSIGLLSLYLGAMAGLCVDVDVCCLNIIGWHTDAVHSSHEASESAACCSKSNKTCCITADTNECDGDCPTAEIAIDFQDDFHWYASQNRIEITVQEIELLSSADISIESNELESVKAIPPDGEPPSRLSDSPYLEWCRLIFYG